LQKSQSVPGPPSASAAAVTPAPAAVTPASAAEFAASSSSSSINTLTAISEAPFSPVFSIPLLPLTGAAAAAGTRAIETTAVPPPALLSQAEFQRRLADAAATATSSADSRLETSSSQSLSIDSGEEPKLVFRIYPLIRSFGN
jgi:hypothetical protein